MSPIVRRIVYVTFYEGLAILFSSMIFALLGYPAVESGTAAIVSSAVAMGWNFVFTTGFEKWEAGNPVKGRSVLRRVVHALIFEGGLAIVLTPVLSLILGMPLTEAFLTNLGLLVYFLVYTYVFNLTFDRLFGLPASARAQA